MEYECGTVCWPCRSYDKEQPQTHVDISPSALSAHHPSLQGVKYSEASKLGITWVAFSVFLKDVKGSVLVSESRIEIGRYTLSVLRIDSDPPASIAASKSRLKHLAQRRCVGV